ncbi:MAG: putative response regulator rpfG [Proteobacteria bacterium]|nr:putative response regulator rpfG [Pseudomonadota bacterium]
MDEIDLVNKHTILVVDDTPDNLALMIGLLKDDYKVKIAYNGERALKIARSASPPDLILLDVMMPDMDGYEVCRQLKLDPKTMNIPLVFISAKAEVEDERKGLELGAIDYITKPISPPIVLARIKNHLALKAMADFLRDQNDWDTAERLAFTLKGASGNVSVSGLQQFAEKLESAIQERRLHKQADAQSGELTTSFDHIIDELGQKLPQDQDLAAPSAEQIKLKAVCARLETLLAEDDAAAAKLLDAHAELLKAAFPAQYQQIDDNIRSFNFDAALVVLRGVSHQPLTLVGMQETPA